MWKRGCERRLVDKKEENIRRRVVVSGLRRSFPSLVALSISARRDTDGVLGQLRHSQPSAVKRGVALHGGGLTRAGEASMTHPPSSSARPVLPPQPYRQTTRDHRRAWCASDGACARRRSRTRRTQLPIRIKQSMIGTHSFSRVRTHAEGAIGRSSSQILVDR